MTEANEILLLTCKFLVMKFRRKFWNLGGNLTVKQEIPPISIKFRCKILNFFQKKTSKTKKKVFCSKLLVKFHVSGMLRSHHCVSFTYLRAFTTKIPKHLV